MKQDITVRELTDILLMAAASIEAQKLADGVEEKFVGKLIGVTYGWGAPETSNQKNAPAVDLRFRAQKVVVQVTKDRKRAKIMRTLQRCEDHLSAEEYERIVMFYSGKRAYEGRQKGILKLKDGKWTIRVPEDIWTYKDLVRHVEECPTRTKELLKVANAFVGSHGRGSKHGETIEVRNWHRSNKWVDRKEHRAIEEQLRQGGLVWIQGLVGTGKTVSVRMCLESVGAQSVRLYELKNLDQEEQRQAFEEATEATEKVIWLEDVTIGRTGREKRALGRLVERCQTERRCLVVTSHELPMHGGNFTGSGKGTCVELGNLSPDEIEARARKAGLGSNEGWFASAVASGGNPALVDSYFTDRETHDPLNAMLEGDAMRRLRSTMAREAVENLEADQCAILGMLVPETRGFTRSQAKQVTGVDVTGTALRPFTALEGKWLERLAGGKLRVSPLLADLYGMAVDEDGRRGAHERWAQIRMEEARKGTVDIDGIVRNSIAAESESKLNVVSYWILTITREEIPEWRKATFWLANRVDKLTEHWITQRGLLMLKLALLRLSLPSETEKRERLVADLANLVRRAEKEESNAGALAWLLTVCTFTRIEQWHEATSDVVWWTAGGHRAHQTCAEAIRPENTEGSMLAITPDTTVGQIALWGFFDDNTSIERLAGVMRDLGTLDESTRKSLLKPIEWEELSNGLDTDDIIEVAINKPWVALEGSHPSKVTDLIPWYERIRETVSGWRDERPRVYLSISISVLENEYAGRPGEAIRALEIPVEEEESKAKVLIARAKIEEEGKRWGNAAILRAEARMVNWEPRGIARMITRRADAITAWMAGEPLEAAGLFEDGHRTGMQAVESLQGIADSTSPKEDQPTEQMSDCLDRARALRLDALVARAVAGDLATAIVGVYNLGLELLGEPCSNGKVGNRLTRSIAHIGLWLKYLTEGWTHGEIDAGFGIHPGLASREDWDEDPRQWRVGRKNYYLAAAYHAALAQLAFQESEALLNDLEKSEHKIEGMELLVAHERKEQALRRYDPIGAIKYGRRVESLGLKLAQARGLTREVPRKTQQESSTQMKKEHVETLVIAAAIQETLDIQNHTNGEPAHEKTLTFYEGVKEESGKLDWVEALKAGASGFQKLKSHNSRALFRTLTAIERRKRLGREHSNRHETWRWAVQIWLYAEVNSARTVIDEALHEWLIHEGMWSPGKAHISVRRQQFAEHLLRLADSERGWKNDLAEGVVRQLREASQKVPELPKLGP